ncbi:hypothetical protein [Streptacidiphilus cavernicola]|uniref:DUF3168 domain-containing protein n=1 Tax=Streptacidiphilus cavernicola TaxID=3342716 RepID=A0ABV6VPE4_9ACTN
MPVSGRTASLAVQTMLQTATGRSCGYGTLPTTASLPTGVTMPYSVLYELGQTPSGPPFGDSAADARMLFQVSSVGSTAEQASLMADKVRTAFMAKAAPGSAVFATPIPIPGYAVTDREVDREDGTTSASSTYTYLQRFALSITTTGS